MKITIDIPDSIIPEDIKKIINGPMSDKQTRILVEALLRLTGDVFDECEISTEYRLELK